MSPLRAVAAGALTVGLLDILDAFVFFWARSGAKPTRILQAISAGVLGRQAAIAGGNATAVLGLALHFFIAFSIVTVLYLAARQMPSLVRKPFITGPVYGLIVYAVMNYVVIPLSAAAGAGGLPPVPVLINGLLIHMFGVGIPAAFFVREALHSHQRPEPAYV
jgi:hypothetical protein